MRLIPGARETIEDHAICTIALADPLDNHTDHHLIRHQLAPIHVRFRQHTQLCATPQSRAKQITASYMDESDMFFEYLCLRALTGARRTKQNNIHAKLSPLVVEQPGHAAGFQSPQCSPTAQNKDLSIICSMIAAPSVA